MKIKDLNYKGFIDWGIDTKDMEFRSCREMQKETPLRLKGVFIMPDNGYGETPFAILDGVLLKLPQRYIDTVKTIVSDGDMVEEIKSGKVAIEISTFVSKKYHKEGFDITFVEV